MNKIAIYTVLTGNYDELRQPEVIDETFDYICFSNDIRESQIGIWQVRPFDNRNTNATRESRYPKLNPHAVLPEYEYSLYTDAKIRIDAPVFQRAKDLAASDCILAMIPHMLRDCVYQEAFSLACARVGEQNLIWKQTRFLLAEKFPQHQGLYDCAVMLRKHNTPEVIIFSTNWWNFYCQFSSRDQMAVSYALHKAKLTPKIFFPSSFYRDHTFPHLKKRKTFAEFSLTEKICHYFEIYRMKWLLHRHGISC